MTERGILGLGVNHIGLHTVFWSLCKFLLDRLGNLVYTERML